MICFRDMTFCTAFPKRCGNAECHRAFTAVDREAAREWWGKNGEPPIAMSDLSPGCNQRVSP